MTENVTVEFLYKNILSPPGGRNAAGAGCIRGTWAGVYERVERFTGAARQDSPIVNGGTFNARVIVRARERQGKRSE